MIIRRVCGINEEINSRSHWQKAKQDPLCSALGWLTLADALG